MVTFSKQKYMYIFIYICGQQEDETIMVNGRANSGGLIQQQTNTNISWRKITTIKIHQRSRKMCNMCNKSCTFEKKKELNISNGKNREQVSFLNQVKLRTTFNNKEKMKMKTLFFSGSRSKNVKVLAQSQKSKPTTEHFTASVSPLAAVHVLPGREKKKKELENFSGNTKRTTRTECTNTLQVTVTIIETPVISH